ncbi:hypothetical protein D8S78_23220 [Natrialba swarupiae]|nr:hypothetical protein [Natrialba swarupiae]
MATENSCPHGDVDRSAAMTDDVTTSSRVERILDTHREALQDGQLPMTVYNDEIFETELHRIFGQCWMFIGHETEVPEPGDYAKRYIGKDPFIFIRGEDGQIRVLFDSCTHHGSQLCKAEQGNSSHFRCPYHGWTFKTPATSPGSPPRPGLRGARSRRVGTPRSARVETTRASSSRPSPTRALPRGVSGRLQSGISTSTSTSRKAGWKSSANPPLASRQRLEVGIRQLLGRQLPHRRRSPVGVRSRLR